MKNIFYRKHAFKRGSRESDQNKRPLRLRFAVLIGGAGFSCRIGRKILVGKCGL